MEIGLTWTGRSCRLKEKRASTKTPSPNRKTATIGSAASAVMNELKTTAPKKAPIAPGIASGQTFAQSTFLNRQWEAPDAAVVPTSAMCTLADARAGAMPIVNSRLCEVTP